MRQASILLFLVFVLSALGGFAARTLLMPHKEPDRGQVIVPAPMVDMRPLAVAIVHKGVAYGQYVVVVRLKSEKGKRRYLRAQAPRLEDLFLKEMYTHLSSRLSQGKDLDLPYLKVRLLLSGRRKLGDGILKDVLIASVYRQ